MRNIEELSELIIGALCERKGFDIWWDSLEDEDQDKIQEDLQSVISDWQYDSYNTEYEDGEDNDIEDFS